jgi:hypothetical protein
VNRPLASANRSSADADPPHILLRSESVSKMFAFLEISELGSYIEDEMRLKSDANRLICRTHVVQMLV